MKSFIAIVVLVAFVAAEPPLSNSYLPPSLNSNGYPSGGSDVVAARSFNQGGIRGFARNGNQGFGGPRGRFNAAAQPGLGQQAGPFDRNGFEDPSGTVSYEADERGFKPRISYDDATNGNGYNDNGPQNGGFGKARARGY